MIFRNLVRKLTPKTRKFHTTQAVRSGHEDTTGIFGSNLPFGVENRNLLFLNYIIFLTSGTTIPFIALRSMILSKNQ